LEFLVRNGTPILDRENWHVNDVPMITCIRRTRFAPWAKNPTQMDFWCGKTGGKVCANRTSVRPAAPGKAGG